jgi:hypothetical protein
LEKSKELIALELESSQKRFSQLSENYSHYNNLFNASQYYKNIDEFTAALDCEDEIILYENLEAVLHCLNRCNDLQPCIDTVSLNNFTELHRALSDIKETSLTIDTTILTSVSLLNDYLTPVQNVHSEIDTAFITECTELFSIFEQFQDASTCIDTEYIEDFLNLLFLLNKLYTNEVNYEGIGLRIKEEEKIIKNFKYECPVKGTVYVVGGECLSAEKAI